MRLSPRVAIVPILPILHGAVLPALIAAYPATVAAYCRTTTVEPDAGAPPDACPTGGVPLYWPTRELSYAINQRGLPGLDEATLRAVLEAAFGAWTEVDCDGEPIDLSVMQAEQLTELDPSSKDVQPRPNVIAHIEAAEWVDDDHAFAITKLRYSPRTGHILGVDMLFNGGKAPFIVCPDAGCDEGESGTDLPNVVTHEAGHFFGLAHSDEPSSTMWFDAKGSDTDKRSLEADDRAGICAIYGPDAVLGPPPSPRGQGGGAQCRVASVPSPHGTGLGPGWLLLGLFLLARRTCALRRRLGPGAALPIAGANAGFPPG
jgi:hypothetical protein